MLYSKLFLMYTATILRQPNGYCGFRNNIHRRSWTGASPHSHTHKKQTNLISICRECAELCKEFAVYHSNGICDIYVIPVSSANFLALLQDAKRWKKERERRVDRATVKEWKCIVPLWPMNTMIYMFDLEKRGHVRIVSK